MGKRFMIIICGVAVLVLGGLLARSFSQTLALKGKGFASRHVVLVDRGYIGDGQGGGVDYQVVTTRKGEAMAAVYMEKNRWGFWRVRYGSEADKTKWESGVLSWMLPAGFRSFASGDRVFVTERHTLYYGEQAHKLIDIPAETYPPGSAMQVQQAGGTYLVHVTTYEEPESNLPDIRELLEGFIRQELK